MHTHDVISFDEVLSKIGFGKYQRVIYVSMALMGITEGAQVTLFNLMIPILKKEWDVPDYINKLQISLIFVGFVVGSMISGQFADRYGRKRPFLYSTFISTVIALGTVICTDIYQLAILRAFMGILGKSE